MCCNIKYVKKYITVKIIKIDLINFERNFIGPSVPIKSKQNHATFGHSWNHNKDLAILCFYRYFSTPPWNIHRKLKQIQGKIVDKHIIENKKVHAGIVEDCDDEQ